MIATCRRYAIRTLLPAVLLVALAASAASCAPPGTRSTDEQSVDLDKGRQLFQATCRSCHTLADANASGMYGPDLDDVRPDRERVLEQIEEGGGGMPSGILGGEDADTVAGYVAEVAGTGDDRIPAGGDSAEADE